MKILFFALVLAISCFLIWSVRDNIDHLPPPAKLLKPGKKPTLARPTSQKKPDLLEIKRLQAFDQLKARWKALSEDDRKAEIALIKESLDLLFGTVEFVMLGEYLESIDKGHFFIEVKSKAEKRFSKGDPNDARAKLVRMVKELRESGIPPGVDEVNVRSQIQLWCFEAGKNCPPAEFQSFCDALENERFVQQATFGRNLTLVTTDPKGAVTSTMALLKHDTNTVQSHQFLSILLTNLPSGSNYAAFEQMLPPDQGNYRYDLKGARAALLSEWAAHDITAAANYVVSHPERIVPENMESVVTGYIVKDMAAGLEWIQTFPEGPWFDHAARVAANWIAEIHPNEARELALQIQNKDIRQECVSNAEHYLSLQKK